MDVNQQTVIDALIEHDCLRLIHGHTHRPDIHDLKVNDQSAQRFVLADWKKDSASLLRWSPTGYQIENIE